MDRISLAVLWFFIFVRVVIFFGIAYFVLSEFRKYKKKREENGERDKEDS
jgi:hypothetical protein